MNDDNQGLFPYFCWKDAYKLIEAEINLIDKNKHFNTLNLQYFKSLNNNYRNSIMTKDYYNKYIKNYLFYGLEDEVFNKIYYLPKNNYSFRKMSFNSYVIRMIHNAIGIFLFHVSNDFVKENILPENSKIKSFYGGLINYDDSNNIILHSDNLYYKKQYKEFCKLLLTYCKDITDKRIVFKLDIQNFFDSINVKNFLYTLKKYIKYSVQKNKYNFSNSVIDGISEFYKFSMNGNEGIPQSDNDLCASFMSSLYMKLIDIEILDIIVNMEIEGLKDYHIVQYCDDTYIILDFEEIKDESNFIIRELLNKISLVLMEKHDLKFNDKTTIYDFDDKSQIDTFKINLKINSQVELELTQGEKAQDVFEKVVEAIKNINENKVNFNFEDNDAIFKKIYNKSVNDIMSKKENKLLLEDVLSQLDFNNVYLSSKYITTLICKSEENKKRFLDYLNNTNGKNKDYLAFNYIFTEDFNYRESFLKNISDEYLKNVLDFYILEENDSGYMKLNKIELSLLNIYEESNIIYQIKMRRIAENEKNYNIAFNHLTNEVKSLIYYFSANEIDEKSFKASHVKEYLIANNYSLDLIIKIVNMFDRRNNNKISHSNGEVVSEKEYYKYKKYAELLLKKIAYKKKKHKNDVD